MSIPEAAQLVLQAGAMGKGGEIYVLDMGEPVKIVDLARQTDPALRVHREDDIRIEFTGLRPGREALRGAAGRCREDAADAASEAAHRASPRA